MSYLPPGGFCSVWFTGGQKDKSVKRNKLVQSFPSTSLQTVVTVTGNLAEPSWRSVTLLSLQKAACSPQSREFKANSRHTVNPRKIAMLAPKKPLTHTPFTQSLKQSVPIYFLLKSWHALVPVDWNQIGHRVREGVILDTLQGSDGSLY
jgi:hypothetical protein